MTAPAHDELSRRYGTHRPVRRGLLVAAVVALVLVALGWVVWATLAHSRPLAQSELRTFRITGAHSAVATVTVVRRDDDVVADCLLRAQAADHSVVGELSFTVDGSQPVTTTLQREVRTERRATSVSLVGCRTPEQQRLR